MKLAEKILNMLDEGIPMSGTVVSIKDVPLNDKEKIHKMTSLGVTIDKKGKVTIDAKPWKTKIHYNSEKEMLKDFKWKGTD